MALIALSTESFPTEARSTVRGWLHTSGTLGGTAGLSTIGLLSDAMGGTGAVIASLGVASLILAPVVFALPESARAELVAAGLYGVRVSVHDDLEGELPYSAWFANLIVSDGMLLGEEPAHTWEEVARHLRPEGSVRAREAGWTKSGERTIDFWVSPYAAQAKG